MAYESYQVFQKPLCLIDSDKDGKLMAVDDVLNRISQIPKQLNVVAIAGLYRTGKSYLLNRLAQVNKGSLNCDVKRISLMACTLSLKKFANWSRREKVIGNSVHLFFDMFGDKNHDNWIFTLATLLGSTLVYNAMGKFDQDALEKLSFITELSKHVKISDSPSSQKGAEDLDLYLPLFILALRDFCLELKSNGRDITSDEYLEECLSVRSGNKDFDVRYNTPRICIRKYFRRRKCFTFDRPGSKTTLKKLETLTDEDLEEEFGEDSNKFADFVLRECLPKFLDNGQPVNGRMFATLTQAYVAAIRHGKIPCIESALNMMAQIENNKVVEACVQLYVEKMNNTLQFPDPNDNDLSDAHHRCLKDAIDLFLKKAVYDQNHEYQREANEKKNGEYDNFKKRNEHVSEVKSKEALLQLYTRAGGYGLYQQDIMKIKDDYEKLTGLGCKKQETILKYLESKWVEGQTILQADQQVTEMEKEAENKHVLAFNMFFERQRTIAAERLREEGLRNAEIQLQKFEDESRQLQENIRQLERKQQEEIKNVMDHQNKVLDDRLKEQKRLLKEGFNAEAAKLRNDIERLRQENERIRQQGGGRGGRGGGGGGRKRRCVLQ
ncbi:hypothetical protein ACJMK2_039916 [Sinanodonta woodiana]|uniref:GB1/RHD3-type G domain-containing protein n=1 Tax=Sinanodonta woodiana TaxID=1069815 RepID=A0ABD3WDF1_SINWO